MAARYGIDNIDFLRGDILDLPKLGRSFDHAECVGVLYHMADPRAGLQAVSTVLRPGAFLRLGLYGESARALVVKARRDIEMARLSSTLDGLREFRRKVMSGEWRRLRPLTAWEDFWSANLLRDLCFHVQEHRFTVSRLRSFLEGSGLRFLGFEFNVGASQSAAANASPLELYRARFPTERTMSDLARWEQLEREKSNLFPGYAFICQKELSHFPLQMGKCPVIRGDGVMRLSAIALTPPLAITPTPPHLSGEVGLQSAKKPGPPRRFNSSPASRPIAAASVALPRRSVSITCDPSGRAIRARRCSAPSVRIA